MLRPAQAPDAPALAAQFETLYGRRPTALYYAPGRVNLIGEHLDYNGGPVLPTIVGMGIAAAVAPRTDGRLRLASATQNPSGLPLPPVVEPDVQHHALQYDERQGWANYPIGVLDAYIEAGVPLGGGFDVLYDGTLPTGSGLSSSAAIEVLTGYWFLHQHGRTPHTEAQLLDLAQTCKRVENAFIGVSCGIMDQAAVALGRPNEALLLHCDTLQTRRVPLDLGPEYALVVMNTNVPRELIHSAYNERLAECRSALQLLQTRRPHLLTLAQATHDDLRALWSHTDLASIPPDLRHRRARHVVEETQRVHAAVAALEARDVPRFARLLNRSQASLRDLYAVTGPHLDALVEAAQQAPGCLGARMTGAGFGGCALAVVRIDNLETFDTHVSQAYHAATGLQADLYAMTTAHTPPQGLGVTN